MSGLQQVHVRVNDAATGQPTPVRLRITDFAGEYYAPFGRMTEFATGPGEAVGGNVKIGSDAWATIDGNCEVLLPPGDLCIEVEKGPEYRALTSKVLLPPGKLALRVEIERWCDMRGRGWHSGDTRVHFLPPHSALLEAQAEDVAVVQLLIRHAFVPVFNSRTKPSIANLDAFSGQAPCLQAAGHLVAVNTFNFHAELGSLGLLHCHRVVYPLTFGGPNGEVDWTLADWCGQCHRKGGLVVWTRTQHRCGDFEFGEPLVDLLLGQVDAFEVTTKLGLAMLLWHDLLNLGFRMPLAGASGKNSNAIVLGSMRTYVQLPAGQPLTLPAWIEGLRAGRSFVTNGPLVDFTVNGQGPGSVVLVEAGKVSVRAEAKSWRPFERLEIVCGGATVAAASAQSAQPTHAALEAEVPIECGAWLAVRCSGETFAQTSPVYIEVPGRPLPPDREAAARLLREVDRMIEWCRTKARCPTPQARDRLLAGFVKARDWLQAVGS